MNIIRQRGLRIAEFWLDESFEGKDIDVALLKHYNRTPEQAQNEAAWTLNIDLGQTQDQLLNGMNEVTRYEVRRAQKRDELTFECIETPTQAHIDEFALMQAEFCRTKGLPNQGVGRAIGMQAQGILRMSRVLLGDQTLVWHVHFEIGDKARLLHSNSLFRATSGACTPSLLSRANRYLHWQDLLWFKQRGRVGYDLGGWYAGQTDQGLLAINRFKEGLGGAKDIAFDARIALTAKGRLYERYQAFKRKIALRSFSCCVFMGQYCADHEFMPVVLHGL